MDINAALERMRQLVNAVNDTEDDLAKAGESAMAMAVVFESIDGWLSKGGFKPADWS
jgi:hypothetical protein